MTPTHFGHWVAQQRAAQGLTQKQLATRLGCTQSVVAQLEAGRNDLTLGRVSKICKALGIKSFVIEL